ncbi:hypothetical protein B5S50_13470 [Clostridium sp. 001]|nr:hypothetical protein B5S50_13470 [Clostridium sp. 001]
MNIKLKYFLETFFKVLSSLNIFLAYYTIYIMVLELRSIKFIRLQFAYGKVTIVLLVIEN